jgi:hypothetical protein
LLAVVNHGLARRFVPQLRPVHSEARSR